MSRAPRAALAVVFVVLLLGLTVRPADAHAVLVSSTPGDGAALAAAPAEVALEFNEPVSAELGGLRVFDADGGRVDEGSVRTSDRTVSIDLVDGLSDGAYVVSYRIVSADGHPVRGGLVFTVGDGAVDTSGLERFFADDGDRGWEIAGAVARWMAMAGTLLVAGGVAFSVICRRLDQPWARRRLAIGAVIGVAGVIASVPIQAALATGQGVGSVLQDGVLRAVLRDGFGAAVGLAVIGLVVATSAVARAPIAAALGALAAVASFPVVGHTRFDDVAVGIVADAVHVGAAAVWTGGLVFLLGSLRRIVDAGIRATTVGRFSTLATISIVVVGLAGVGLSWTEVKALDALTSTAYGWTLLAKLGVVAAIAAAGGYNHFRLVPAVVAAPANAVAQRRLSSVLRFEVAGAALAVAATAVLVNLTPAYVDAGIGQLHSEILDLGEAGSVQLVVDPNRAGENSVHLYFYDPSGAPAEIATDVRLDLSKPGDDIGPIQRTPFRAGPAHFQWDGTELVSSGRWEITVVARLDRFSEETATADVLVG